MDLGLEGRVALVTGGSRGIGRSIAVAFAREGADVAICGRDEAALAEVAEAVRKHDVRCVPIASDLADPSGCSRFIDTAVSSLDRVDVLVNNATAAAMATPDSDEEALLQRIWDKALPGIRCSRLAVPHIAEAGGGSIVFVGGLAARMPLDDYSPFVGLSPGTSTLPQGLGNAALANYSKYLSDEVGKLGITVNVVHPALVVTDRIRDRLSRYAEEVGSTLEEVRENIDATVPMGRLAEPEDIASLVTFLASARASAITGECIAVDGGFGRTVLY